MASLRGSVSVADLEEHTKIDYGTAHSFTDAEVEEQISTAEILAESKIFTTLSSSSTDAAKYLVKLISAILMRNTILRRSTPQLTLPSQQETPQDPLTSESVKAIIASFNSTMSFGFASHEDTHDEEIGDGE